MAAATMPHRMRKPSPCSPGMAPGPAPLDPDVRVGDIAREYEPVSVEPLQDTRAAEVQADHDEPYQQDIALPHRAEVSGTKVNKANGTIPNRSSKSRSRDGRRSSRR